MAKKGGKGNKKARRVAEQAAAEALVRFGPELSGLTELQRSAQSTYAGDIRNATQTALGISGAARAARPEIQRVYERAGGQLTNTMNQVTQDIGPNPNSAIAQALVAENAAARTQLRGERVASYKDMTNRIVNAQEGRATAVRAARSTLATELGKVQRRRADVLREKGAFTAATLSGLLQAETDRATRIAIQKMSQSQQERNSLRSAGYDPDTGLPTPGGKLDPDANAKPGDQSKPAGKSTWASQEQHAAAQDKVGQARQVAARLKKGGSGFDAAIHGLVNGLSEQTVPVYKTVVDERTGRSKQVKVLNKDGTPVTKTIPGIPKVGSALLVRAAVEAEYLGYISKRTQRLLHERRLRIKALGLPSYGSRPRGSTPTTTGTNFAPGANGQIRPN